MKNVLLALLVVSSFSTQAATCYFMPKEENDLQYSIMLNTDEHVDLIRSNMTDDNIVSRNMFYKSYIINEAGMTYKVVQVDRSCGKGCEIGTFLEGIEILGVSYIPQGTEQCLL